MRPNSPPQTTSGFVQQAAPLQIANQGRGSLVHVGTTLFEVLVDILVVVPRLAGAVVDVNIADAALHQPSRQQAAVGERRVAVFRADRFGLLADIEHIQRFELHPVRRFHGLDAAFEIIVGAERLRSKSRFRAWIASSSRRCCFGSSPLVAEIGDHLLRLDFRVAEADALMLGGQESGTRQRPFAAWPTGVSTTNAGRFSFSVPRP